MTNLRRSTRLGCLRALIVLFILAGYLILVSGLGLRTGWHSSSVGTKLAQDRQAQEDPGPHSFEELPLWIGTRYGQRADCCQSSSSSSQRLYPGSPVGAGSFSPKSYSHAARQAILVVQLVQEVVLPQCILLPSVWQGLVQGYDLGPFLAAGSRHSPGRQRSPGRPPPPPQPPQVPHAKQLPKPPKPPASKGKGKSKASDTGSALATPVPQQDNGAETRLAEVLSALSIHKERLPEDLQALIASQQATDASAKARALHQQVSAQASFTKELATLRAQRFQYQKSWQQYVQHMTSQFSDQVAEQKKVMEQFAQREEFLKNAAKQALVQVLSIAGGGDLLDRATASEAPMTASMDGEEDPWKDFRPSDLVRAQEVLTRNMKKASKEAKSALLAVKQEQETSRTPRRGDKRSAESIESSDSQDGSMQVTEAANAAAPPVVPAAPSALRPFGLPSASVPKAGTGGSAQPPSDTGAPPPQNST